MTYTTQTSWKEIMNYLPKAYHFTCLLYTSDAADEL